MQEQPRNSDEEESKWPAVMSNETPEAAGIVVQSHSRQSSKPLENSNSLVQEEFGSAEAMEYTPSNTSQNNSIPTQLVTNSNSNLNLSHVKGGSSIMFGANLNSVSQSPSPYNYSQQVADQPRIRSFKEQQTLVQSQHPVNNRLDFSQGGAGMSGGPAMQNQQIGANSLMTQDPSLITQSFPGMRDAPANQSQSKSQQQPMVVEDDFFDQQASLLMQQQRSQATKQPQVSQQSPYTAVQQQSFQQPLIRPNAMGISSAQSADSSQMQHQLISHSTTPGFQNQSMTTPHAAQSSEQANLSNQAQNIQVQNFSINTQEQTQSHQLQNPPQVASQKRVVPHQTISLLKPQQQVQHQQNIAAQQQMQQHSVQRAQSNAVQESEALISKLQLKVREQAQRLQAEAQYRLLCEKRIKKLDPHHPLPIQFEHLELGAFSPVQTQSAQSPAEIGAQTQQMYQLEQSRQLVAHLQSRISELNQQLTDRNSLEQRLKQAEESLRNEVLQSEEQRAYIEMLKDQVDQKIKNIGLSFDADPMTNAARSADVTKSQIQKHNSRMSALSSQGSGQLNRSKQSLNKSHSQNRHIDGVIQITSLQKACEDLKIENDLLKIKAEQQNFAHSTSLNEQKDALQSQIEHLQSQLQQEVNQRNHLTEKNETLLEFAQGNIDSQANQDARLTQIEHQRQSAESQMQQSVERVTAFEQELVAKSNLLEQVKTNLEEIRAEKIQIQAHMQTLTNEKEDLSRKLETMQTLGSADLNRLQAKVTEQQMEINSLKERGQNKDDLLKSTEQRLESAIESEKYLKAQINSEFTRAQNVNSENFTLKHTLVDSQQEMDTLVTKYDKAVEDLIQKDSNITKLTDDLLSVNREFERQIETNAGLQKKNESQQKEISDVYGSLRRKEEVLRNMEERLNRKLSEREDQCITLQSKLNHLEQTFSRETNNVESLRRMCEERSQVGATLENTLREKDGQIQSIKTEVAEIRLAGEKAYREREEELLQQLQHVTAKEFNMTHESEQITKKNTDLEDQLNNAQKINLELQHKVSNLESEVQQKDQARQRWEDEVKRLESSSNCANMQNEDLQRDFDRIRQQQVDDAILIDRMRIAQGEMKDQVNEIVGRITKFGYNLEEIGQTNLPDDLESAYEISKKIEPVTQDICSTLQYISNFIRPLSNDVVTRLQNVPERDSGRNYSPNLAQCQSEQENTRQQQTDPKNLDSYSNRQQLQASNFTLMSQRQQQQQYSMQANAVVTSIADSGLAFSHQHENPSKRSDRQQPSVITNVQQNQSMEESSIIVSLKSQIMSLEQTLLLDQEEKEDLEQALKVVLQISTLANPYKLLIQELQLRLMDINKTRRDKYSQTSRLLQMEQQYHYKSKLALNQSVQAELTLLKQEIIRERQHQHELENQLIAHQKQQQRIIDDILRTNSFALDVNVETHMKLKQLQDMYEEANIQRQEMKEQLEWNQALLQEQRLLRDRFQPRDNSGEQKSRDPSEEQPSRLGSALRQNSAQRRISERDGATQSALKNYLPADNNKTDQELKSELFNRKQIFSAREDGYDKAYENRAHVNSKLGTSLRESLKKEDEAIKQSSVLQNTLYKNQTSHLRQRSPYHNAENQAMHQARDSSNSLERSKSPQANQASDLIRRKYSQLKTAPTNLYQINSYGVAEKVSSPRHDTIEGSKRALTMAQLQHVRPLRRSPQRDQQPQGLQSSSKSNLVESRSPGRRERDLLNEVAANQFKRF